LSRYRLILLDLDGTLLNARREIHAENLRALRALMKSGVHVGIATGRPPLSVRPYAELLSPNAPLVHFNGAMARDWSSGRVIFERALPFDAALAAIRVARSMRFHVNVYVGDEIWIDQKTPTSRESEEKDGVPHRVVGDVVARLREDTPAITKLMFIGPRENIGALTKAIVSVIHNGATLVNSEPEYLEMLPLGCNKLTAAEAVAKHLGIEMNQVIAFGDNKNDLELLLGAGLGVAMGNAHADVLSQVKVKIGHHNTDAIARFLDKTFS
jgi:Cof subfamily protein (haloacid dehalogenase superfamily)